MESLSPTLGPHSPTAAAADRDLEVDPHSPLKAKSLLSRPTKHSKSKHKTLPVDNREGGGSQATLLGQDSSPDFFHTAPPTPRLDERSTRFSQPVLPLPSSSSTLCDDQETDTMDRFVPTSSAYWEELASAIPLPTTATSTTTTAISRPSTPLATPPATSPILPALDLGDTSIDSRFFADGHFDADPDPGSDSIDQLFIHRASHHDDDGHLLNLNRAMSPQPALVSPPSSSPPPSMFQSELSFALGGNASPSVASTASRSGTLGGSAHSPYLILATDSRPSAPSTPSLHRTNPGSPRSPEPSTAVLIRNLERLVQSVWPGLDRNACMQPAVVDAMIQQRRDENHEITTMLAEMDLFDTEMSMLRATLTQKESLLAYLGTLTGAAHAPQTPADVDRAVDRGRAPANSPPATSTAAPDWHTYMHVRSDLASATSTVTRLEAQLADAHAQVQEFMNKLVDQRATAHAHLRDLEAERAGRARDQDEHAATAQRMVEREQAAYARADEWERAACEAAGLVGELRARVGEVEAKREALGKERERVEARWREATDEAARWRREGKEARLAVDEALKAGKVKGVDGAHGKSKDAVPLAEYTRNAIAAVVGKAHIDRDEAVAKIEMRMRKVEEERDAMERDLMDCAGLIAGHEEKLAALEREAQGLREEVGRLEWQVREGRERDEAVKRQVEEQAKEAERLRGELDAANKECQEVGAQLVAVTSERDGALSAVADVRAKLDDIVAEKERVAAELEQAATDRDAARTELATMQAELESTQSQLTANSQQLASATDDLAAAQTANAALDSTAQRQKKEIKKLSQRVRDLEKQVATTTAHAAEVSKSLEAVQESLGVEVVARKDAEDAQRASVEELTGKHAAKLAECEALAQQLKDTQAQAVDLQTQVDQVTIQLDASKSQEGTAQARIEELTLERDRLAADLAEKQTELHRSRLRTEDLAQQLRMVESQAASATARVLAIQADNDNLVSNASKLTSSITELQNTLDAAVTARTRAHAELDRTRKEISGLQATVQEYEQLGDHVGVAAASAGSAMRELDSARRRIGDLEQEAEGLRSQVRELESVLRTWTAERDSSYRVTGALRAQVAFWRERAEGRGAGGAGGGVHGAQGSGALIGSSTSSSASSIGSGSAGGGGATSTATSAARRFGRLFS